MASKPVKLKFASPPKPRPPGRPNRWRPRFDALRSHPGRWAEFNGYASRMSAYVSAANARKVLSASERGKFEFRYSDTSIFVRFIGRAKS